MHFEATPHLFSDALDNKVFTFIDTYLVMTYER